jgi:hypothetical protein
MDVAGEPGNLNLLGRVGRHAVGEGHTSSIVVVTSDYVRLAG